MKDARKKKRTKEMQRKEGNKMRGKEGGRYLYRKIC